MEFTTAVFIFILGLCSGALLMFLKQRLDDGSQSMEKALNSCQQENAQLKQNWQDQLADYRSLATNLQEMSQHIQNQVDDAEQILTAEPTRASIPFFSTEATNILKSVSRKKREKAAINDQPLDYSDSGSGLFQNQTSKQTSNSDQH